MSRKYEKINYCIIGRFPAGRKYGITTKTELSGYKMEGYPDIAICSRGGWWYVDHIPTGLGIVTVGSKTREAAADEYISNYHARVEGMKDNLKKAVEIFENAPLEETVINWEVVNFCTTSNWRFDKITRAAHNAGLITKKADENTYLDGGNINIIGSPEDLEAIRKLIAKYEETDTERAETISANDTAAETVQEIAVIVSEETPDQKPEEKIPARDPKQARGPVPEKSFIGSAIQGAGWKILFDAATNRTRVIFEKEPGKAARAAVENAGFYYSRNMNSWNKKLTFRAYRAAQKLAAELNSILAA